MLSQNTPQRPKPARHGNQHSWPMLAVLGTVLGAALLASCGYRVLNSRAPFGVRRMAVIPFDERSPFGISPEIASALSRKLAAGGVHITAHSTTADGVLTGVILSSPTVPAPTGLIGAPIPSYQVHLRLRAELRGRDGELLWSAVISLNDDFFAVLGEQEDYPILATETNRRLAMKRLAQRAAEAVHTQLMMAQENPPPNEPDLPADEHDALPENEWSEPDHIGPADGPNSAADDAPTTPADPLEDSERRR